MYIQGYILEDIRPAWRQQMANTLQRERLDYVSNHYMMVFNMDLI